MSRRLFSDWIAVSALRTIDVTWIFWVLLAFSAYFEWGGPDGWTDFFLPLCWMTLLAFAALLAFRKYELTEKGE